MDEAGNVDSSKVLNQTMHVLQHTKIVNSDTRGWSITELSDVPAPALLTTHLTLLPKCLHFPTAFLVLLVHCYTSLLWNRPV